MATATLEYPSGGGGFGKFLVIVILLVVVTGLVAITLVGGVQEYEPSSVEGQEILATWAAFWSSGNKPDHCYESNDGSDHVVIASNGETAVFVRFGQSLTAEDLIVGATNSLSWYLKMLAELFGYHSIPCGPGGLPSGLALP